METIIHLTDREVKVTQKNDDGMSSTKNTSLEAITNILTAQQSFKTPLLPGQWGVIKYIRQDTNEFYAYTVPPSIREVSYDFRNNDVDETRTFRIPVPAQLWLFKVRYNPADDTRRLHSAMVHALKNPIMSENDPVFKMPFSNVGGNVCWGSSSDTPVINSAKSLQSTPTQFFLRPFNNDLGDNRFNAFNDDREGREGVSIFRVQHLFDYMHEKLAAAEEAGETYAFPDSCLRSSRTVQEAIHDYFGVS